MAITHSLHFICTHTHIHSLADYTHTNAYTHSTEPKTHEKCRKNLTRMNSSYINTLPSSSLSLLPHRTNDTQTHADNVYDNTHAYATHRHRMCIEFGPHHTSFDTSCITCSPIVVWYYSCDVFVTCFVCQNELNRWRETKTEITEKLQIIFFRKNPRTTNQ